MNNSTTSQSTTRTSEIIEVAVKLAAVFGCAVLAVASLIAVLWLCDAAGIKM